MKVDLREAVRAARAQRGWSQDRLARETGLTRTTIQNVEAKGGADWRTIDAMIGAFGGVDWLTSYQQPEPAEVTNDLESGAKRVYTHDSSPSLLVVPQAA